MQTNTHRSVVISKRQLQKMKNEFSLRGSKIEFSRKTGVNPDTVTRIISKGRGNLAIVKKIIDYVEHAPKI